MHIHLNIVGFLLMALAMIHVVFPKYFNWEKELSSLSIMNRQMMIVHTFFIALVVFLMGLLCVACANDLIETALGKKVSLGLGIFWTIRAFVQWFVYSPALWKGKKFETLVHVVFSLFWIYLSALFLMIYFN